MTLSITVSSMHAICTGTTYDRLICSFHYACVDTYYYKKMKKNHLKRKHQQARMQQVFTCELHMHNGQDWTWDLLLP